MRKKLLLFAMSMVMAFSLAACGDKTNDSKSSAKDKESTKQESEKESSSKKESEESSALADWYDSKDRTDLENTINKMYNDSGLKFYVEIEEPDTIIYNYQYTEAMDLTGLTQDDVNTYFETSLGAAIPAVQSDIKTFQSTYDMPLTTIRMVYLNTDGTELFSKDVTEDDEVSDSSYSIDVDAQYANLQEWIDSDEAKLTEDATNKMLESSGMSVELGADGDVFIYKYYISDELGYKDATQEQIKTTFDGVVEQNRASVDNLFETFSTSYKIEISAIRFVFCSEDGTELYSADIEK